MSRPSFLPVVLASLCLPLAAFGQAAKAKTSPVELRLLSFNPGGGQQEVFVHDPAAQDAAEGKQCMVKSYLNHEFVSIGLTGRTLVLTTKAARTSLNETGAKVAKVAMPEGVDRGILVLFPAPKNEEYLCRALLIDDSAKAFPPGSLNIINMSPLPVRLTLEKDVVDFKPGDRKVIKDPPVRENNHTSVKAFCYKDNEWKRVASGLWPHPGTKRRFQILFENPQTHEIELRGYLDIAAIDRPKPGEGEPPSGDAPASGTPATPAPAAPRP